MSTVPSLSPLLDRMLALPVREREAWIESLGAEHTAFKPALRGLLEATYLGDTTKPLGDDPLWQSWPAEARNLLEQRLAADEQPGSQVGPYRLLRPLGQGGMGTVWLAERADGVLKRQVALKLPIAGPQSLKRGERFARERDILAALVHPNIARLYDAGVADDGQPYLAMEPIAGEPITVYAQGKSVEQRIGLFRQVLAAVQHAHNQLVVHRDLKPNNILVDAQGQVHLLDFGIALLLDRPAGDDALTEVGQAVLTPNYASPEQIAGQPLGTASDLYSLGVVLYELLCGSKPYRPTRDTRAALEEAVLTGDAVPPSRAAGLAPVAARRLRGDLDNIVLKALRKAPADRYASAEAFSADLQRHLDGVPVLAHPVSLAYRARKFVSRNRVWVGTGALTALALVGGSVATAWQAHEADLQRRQAQLQAAAALRASAEAQAQTARADAALQQARTETTRAEANAALAQAQSERADLRTKDALAARRDAERSATRARAEAAKALATKDFVLGVFQKNQVGDGDTGQSTTARELLETGSERLLADTAMAPEVRFELLGTLGSLTHNLGLNDVASRLHTQALVLAKQLHGTRSPAYWQAAWDQGSGLVARGEYQQARDVLGEAVASMEATTNGRHQDSYAAALMFMGISAYFESRLVESRDLLQRSVDAFAADHPRNEMRPGALRWLGTAHRTLEEFGPAEKRLRESLAVAATSQGLKDFSAAAVHYALGDLYARLGRYADAAPEYTQAHAMQVTTMGPKHTATGLALLELGRTQHQLGRRDEGYAALAEAGEIARTEQSQRPGNMTDRVRFALAQMNVDDGNSGRALALARETVQRLGPAGGVSLASTLLVQAEAEVLDGQLDAADTTLTQALAVIEAKLGREHSQARFARLLRAEILLQRGQGAAAAALLQPLADAVPAAGEAASPRTVWLRARARVGLAEAALLNDRSDPAAAARQVREAVAPVPAATPVLRERVLLARARLIEGRALLAQQRRDEARQATAAALALLVDCQVADSPRLADARRQLASLAP